MKTLNPLLLFAFAFIFTGPLPAQQDSINYWRDQGVTSYEAGDFQTALNEFRYARTFPGNTAAIDAWIDRTFDGYVDLLQKEKRGSELAGLAYKLNKTNPTHAVRIADKALQLNPASYSAALQLNDILDTDLPNFYGFHHKHSDGLTAVALHPEGQLLAAACYDDTIRLIDRQTDRITAIGLAEPALALAFSPDGEHLAVGAADNQVYVFDSSGKQIAAHRTHFADVVAVAFSPNGQYVASAAWDQRSIVWDWRSGANLQNNTHETFVSAIAFHPSGEQLVTGEWNGQIKSWSLDGTLQWTMPAHAGTVSGLAFDPEGQRLFSASWDQTVQVCDPATGTERDTIVEEERAIHSLAFHPQEELLLVGTVGSGLNAWTTAGTLRQEFKGHQQWVNAIDLAGEGRYLLSGDTGGNLLWWDLGLFHRKVLSFEPEAGSVRTFAFDPAEERIVTGHWNSLVQLSDMNGNMLDTFAQHKDQIWTVGFVPQRPLIFSAGRDQVIKFRNTEDRSDFRGPYSGSWIWDAAMTQDGQTAYITGFDDMIKGFRIGETDPFVEFGGEHGNTYGVALSPDESRLAVSHYDHTAAIFTAEGELLHLLEGHQGYVFDIAWSPDGNYLATGGGEGDVMLWNAAGELLHILSAHSDQIYALCFSADSRYILSGSRDRTTRLWDTSGRLLQTFRHQAAVFDVAFTPQTQLPASCDYAGHLYIWNPFYEMLNADVIAPLTEAEAVYYGLEEGEAAPIRPVPIIGNPIHYIQLTSMATQSRNSRNDFKLTGYNLSKKAYASPSLEEQLHLQALAMEGVDSNFALIMQIIEARNLSLDNIDPSIWGLRGFVYSNYAFWLHLSGQHEQALQYAQLDEEFQRAEPEIYNYLQLRLALSLLLNDQGEAANALLDEREEDRFSTPIALRTYYDVTGVDLSEREEPVTARELLLEEIAYLQSRGLTHPDLAGFVERVRERP